jgi:glycosyltransferase involved in cell wall biosynthesis
MHKALMIAFHWPPFSGSSGIQRSLRFARYLPDFGWEPLVLSADPRAYSSVADDLLREIPSQMLVRRAFALDARRHLALGGRYFRFTALPDRWVSWWPAGVLAGLSLIRRHRPRVIYATYPIATAHLIALTLSRLTGLPLVADYRDAMVTVDIPEDPAVRRSFMRLEQRVIRRAAAAIFTTPRSRELYRGRYPAEPAEKFSCIRNGYDERDFPAQIPANSAPASRRLRLLHSGLLKLDERDPRPFLKALAALRQAGALSATDIEVVFRAPGDEGVHRRIIAELGLQDMVRVEGPLPYADALGEMIASDVLLIFQDALCNHLVPAKLYEYIRAQRPVLALCDHGGETAELMREAQAGRVLDLASQAEIQAALPDFLHSVRAGRAPAVPLEIARRYARREQTGELARLFDRITDHPA